MLFKGKGIKQAQNALARKAKLLLARNYFTPEEIALMSKRKALKTLKLISKIENKPYSKPELLELYSYITSELSLQKASPVVVKYFNFVVSFVKQEVETLGQIIKSLCDIFNFRLSLRKVFRI